MTAPASWGGSGRIKTAAVPVQGGLTLALVLLLIVLTLTIPSFLTLRNLEGLLLSLSIAGALAASMMVVMALGEIDLSIGSAVALAGVVASLVLMDTGSIFLGFAAGLAAGGAVGLVNGTVVAGLKINSLIATLATMEITRGLAYIVAGGDALIVQDERFFRLGLIQFLGLTTPVWTMISAFVLFGLLLQATVYGRSVLAIGGNRVAAALAGLEVRRIVIAAFVGQGLLAGLVGVLLAARLSLGDPKTGQGLELEVISACVLGGVSLGGGVARVIGVATGVVILGTVQNAMGLLNVPTFYQYLVRGGILLIAVGADRYNRGARP